MAVIERLIDQHQNKVPEDWSSPYYQLTHGDGVPVVIDAEGDLYSAWLNVKDSVVELFDLGQLSQLFGQNVERSAAASPNRVLGLKEKEWVWRDAEEQFQTAPEDDYTQVRVNINTGEMVKDDAEMIERNVAGGSFQKMIVPTDSISGNKVSITGLENALTEGAQVRNRRVNVTTAPEEVTQEGNQHMMTAARAAHAEMGRVIAGGAEAYVTYGVGQVEPIIKLALKARADVSAAAAPGAVNLMEGWAKTYETPVNTEFGPSDVAARLAEKIAARSSGVSVRERPSASNAPQADGYTPPRATISPSDENALDVIERYLEREMSAFKPGSDINDFHGNFDRAVAELYSLRDGRLGDAVQHIIDNPALIHKIRPKDVDRPPEEQRPMFKGLSGYIKATGKDFGSALAAHEQGLDAAQQGQKNALIEQQARQFLHEGKAPEHILYQLKQAYQQGGFLKDAVQHIIDNPDFVRNINPALAEHLRDTGKTLEELVTRPDQRGQYGGVQYAQSGAQMNDAGGQSLPPLSELLVTFEDLMKHPGAAEDQQAVIEYITGELQKVRAGLTEEGVFEFLEKAKARIEKHGSAENMEEPIDQLMRDLQGDGVPGQVKAALQRGLDEVNQRITRQYGIVIQQREKALGQNEKYQDPEFAQNAAAQALAKMRDGNSPMWDMLRAQYDEQAKTDPATADLLKALDDIPLGTYPPASAGAKP